jgi:hypothetical protein
MEDVQMDKGFYQNMIEHSICSHWPHSGLDIHKQITSLTKSIDSQRSALNPRNLFTLASTVALPSTSLHNLAASPV